MSAQTPREPGLAALGRDVVEDVLRLVRAEIAFARAEMMKALRRLIVAAVFMVVALVFIFIAVIEALGAVPAAFSVRLFGNAWLGWLVLGGLFLLLALLLALLGFLSLRRGLREGKQTLTALKEDSEWLRQLPRRESSAS